MNVMSGSTQIAMLSLAVAMFGCRQPPPPAAPSEITLTHLEIRQIKDEKISRPEGVGNWTVTAKEPFYAFGSIMKSVAIEGFHGSCVVKLRALRGEKFVTIKTIRTPIQSKDEDIGVYIAELEAPEKSGIYFLEVSYEGQHIEEAILKVE